MYRIANNLVKIPANQYLTAADASTWGHQQRFLVPYCSINAYNGSFFLSAVRLWNSLSASAISASINYGWFQNPHQCWYPKTVTLTNMLLTDFNDCIKNLHGRTFATRIHHLHHLPSSLSSSSTSSSSFITTLQISNCVSFTVHEKKQYSHIFSNSKYKTP